MSSTPTPRTVLVTGSGGAVGGHLLGHLLAAGLAVRALDLRHPADLPDGVDARTGSVTDAAALDDALAGVDAVVHLAGRSTEGPWEEVLDVNVHGTWTVLDGCARHGVRKVLLASSNHATGMSPRPGDGTALPADAPARPDTYYGWSKTALESLGRLAVDRHGLDVVALRIGTATTVPGDVRALATWLSPDDLGRLVLAALDPEVRGWHCVWGVSRNTRRWWSLEAGERIGYHPVDDAEEHAKAVLAAARPGGVLDLVGGSFTRAPLGARPS